MSEIKDRMVELKLKGFCCSQIIMQMGLDHMEKENPDLIDAMAGLCVGLGSGKTCGALSSAVCLLYLADPQEAAMSAVQDLTDWFEDSFGSSECSELLGDDPASARVNKCPMIVEATYQMVEELLDWD